ncbi:MAG: folylpolyglutamate synthase/dihydrofolate synthase family protein [Gloeobacterales cyanobacterium]
MSAVESPFSYIDFLQGLDRFGIELGLEPIRELLALMGNPHQSLRVVHVAGTNGKGSTCAYIAQMLHCSGYATGRYTSPHLIDWPERIWVRGQSITPEALNQALQKVAAILEQHPQLHITQFEAFTAAAFAYFAQEQLDYVVVEVGLGGRLDATNVLEHPEDTVITSIGLDHQDRLGDTLAAIAREKAGIIKSGVPIVLGDVPPEALWIIQQRARELEAPLYLVPPAQTTPEGWCMEHFVYTTGLLGNIQAQNSALALQVGRLLGLADTSLREGLAQAQWPGRYQPVTYGGHKLLVDGAHNAEAALALRSYLGEQPVHWIMGVLNTKNYSTMLQLLLRPGDQFSAVPVPSAATVSPQALAQSAERICPDLEQCEAYSTLENALAVLTKEQPENKQTILCGSLYLVGYFLKLLNPSYLLNVSNVARRNPF